MNKTLTKISSILASEIECSIFEEHVVPALEVARKVLATQQPEPRDEVTEAMISAAAKSLSDRGADECNINRDDNWMIYGEQYRQDAMAALEAAAKARAGEGQ
jgi:hypothetical protein